MPKVWDHACLGLKLSVLLCSAVSFRNGIILRRADLAWHTIILERYKTTLNTDLQTWKGLGFKMNESWDQRVKQQNRRRNIILYGVNVKLYLMPIQLAEVQSNNLRRQEKRWPVDQMVSWPAPPPSRPCSRSLPARSPCSAWCLPAVAGHCGGCWCLEQFHLLLLWTCSDRQQWWFLHSPQLPAGSGWSAALPLGCL